MILDVLPGPFPVTLTVTLPALRLVALPVLLPVALPVLSFPALPLLLPVELLAPLPVMISNSNLLKVDELIEFLLCVLLPFVT